MLKTKRFWYIFLFAVLYLIVAGSSFFHACAFFGLANNSWMSVILAFAFEVGQAAVLFSLLTSSKDRSRFIPWMLMGMFTLVQIVGNVFSSYKYLILNSIEDLKYFKEPIFIWTSLPDQQATVIVTWAIGAILPIAALLLTSMITNYLTDQEEEKKEQIEKQKNEEIVEEPIKEIIDQSVEENEVVENPIQKENLEENEQSDEIIEDKSDNDNGEQSVGTIEDQTITENKQPKIDEPYQEGNKQSDGSDNSEIKDLPKDDEEVKNITKEFNDKIESKEGSNDDESDKQNGEELNTPSHFINL